MTICCHIFCGSCLIVVDTYEVVAILDQSIVFVLGSGIE